MAVNICHSPDGVLPNGLRDFAFRERFQKHGNRVPKVGGMWFFGRDRTADAGDRDDEQIVDLAERHFGKDPMTALSFKTQAHG